MQSVPVHRTFTLRIVQQVKDICKFSFWTILCLTLMDLHWFLPSNWNDDVKFLRAWLYPFAKSQDHDRAETTWGLQNISTFTCHVSVCFGEVFYESCQSYLFISQYCGRHNVRLFLICALKSTCLNGSTRSCQYSKTNPAFIHTLDQPQPPFYTPPPTSCPDTVATGDDAC